MKKMIAIMTVLLATVAISSPMRSMIAARASINVSAKAEYTAKDYIQDGLIAMWDGIENAGWGQHDSSSGIWKDLIGSRDATLTDVGSWGDAYLLMSGGEATNTCYASAMTDDGTYLIDPIGDLWYTIEICFTRTSSTCLKGDGLTIFHTGTPSPGAFQDNLARWACIGASATFPFRLSLSCATGGGYDFYNNQYDYYIPQTLSCIYNSSLSGGGMYTGIDTHFWNGVQHTFAGLGGYRGRKYAKRICFGGDLDRNGVSGKFYFCRIYARQLTAEEISHNYTIDKSRFNLP